MRKESEYLALLKEIEANHSMILQLKSDIEVLNNRVAEENLDKREAVSALAKTLEELKELSEEIRSVRHRQKKKLEKLEKLDKGIEVDKSGALWVLIEEFKCNTEAPEDRAYLEVLRQFYNEREQGKFYKMLTRQDIKNLLSKKRGK